MLHRQTHIQSERGTRPVSPPLVLASFKILEEITASSRLFLKQKSCRLSRRLVDGDRSVVTNLELRENARKSSSPSI